jgi:ubiquinone/menaquinone biosynthesis C-methylase UbiE
MTLVQLGKGLLRPLVRYLRRDRAALAKASAVSDSGQSGSIERSPGSDASVAHRKNTRMSTDSQAAVADYWTDYNVTLHHAFQSREESLSYFRWRNDQYFGYIGLMPLRGQDGKVVLDFGCGPGHDLVGFATESKPSRLIGVEVSPSSLAEARSRLALHGAACEFILANRQSSELPLDSGSIDYVHSSGVLHHVPDLVGTLRELRRVLRRDGVARVMVYNYESVWLHLFVAYVKRLLENAYRDLSLEQAFARTTDGEVCPIAHVYRPAEFVGAAKEAGFDAEFTGSALSMHEARMLPYRFEAIQDRRLPEECRRFLLELKFDEHALPRYRGHGAGVDGCYLLKPRS